MKLLIIHNKYRTTHIGGEDVAYKNELKLLQDALGRDNVFSYETSNDHINVFRLLFDIWFSKKHYKNVKKIIIENDIDLIHVHNFFPLLTPSVFKAAKDAKAIVIHTLHNYRLWCLAGIFYRNRYGICEKCITKSIPFAGIRYQCYRKSFLQSLLTQAAFLYYRLINIFDNIDYYFVLTNFQREKVKSLGINEEKIILKPNCFNISFLPKKDRNGYIYVGRVEESKGIVKLLEIWEKLDKKFLLTIIGTGIIEEKLQYTYKNLKNIIFKGKCSREVTLKYISKSKYLIQPSLWYETFGLTIIEAMCSGVPVIGFDIGARSEFIENEINGFLTNPACLAEVLKKSFKFKEYEKLSKNALQTAKQYDCKYVIQKQIEIYKKILTN